MNECAACLGDKVVGGWVGWMSIWVEGGIRNSVEECSRERKEACLSTFVKCVQQKVTHANDL